ncbi:hypothetical protein ACFO5R_05735 [Halosolutus amylolyticus]|uniref:Uncharacterized protein n=1 Tax=Halosolutus amylolyticus TaxID=2932267 RepID=A0ABD5PLD6_9EURY|nr:hypothetical protein [Halosolutus amylolyticus]
MTSGLDPTESYDGRITVLVLEDEGRRERIRCSSYEAAIETAKEAAPSATAVKIVDRDDEVVFTSAEMDIDDWASEWRHAKRRLSVDVEAYDCPYDSVGCFADDRCVQCQIDRVQEQY